jgi:hypothetical protein
MYRIKYVPVVAVLAVALVLPAWTPATLAKDKIKITKVDDLPRHTYEVSAKPSEILVSDEAFADIAGRVRTDVLAILDTYEIEDRSTLQGYYQRLSAIHFLEGDYETAADYVEKARALEQKEAQKLMMGTMGYSYVDALFVEKDPTSEAFHQFFRDNFASRVNAMPWETVRELVEQINGQMSIMTENLLVGLIQGQLDPAVEKAGFLSGDQAAQLIQFRSALKNVVPYKEDVAAVLGEVIASHSVEKKDDIWPARSVTFSGQEGYSPVVVAIWDSGVDVDVFESQRFTNPKEKPDGRDSDGNGYVDDLYGVAYDINHEKTSELLLPLGDQETDRELFEAQLKGFMDVTASINSPEADQIKKSFGTLKAEETKEFLEGVTLYSYHAHGTHVAGITVDGNPYAQVLTVRFTFDHHMVPPPITKDVCKRFGKACGETVGYFTNHNVRVVNMSWGLSLKEIESTLEKNGIGESAEERGKMAREAFEVASKGLLEACKSAPEILFVAAAGNEDNDVEFDQYIPQAFDLPNLLMCGAVDQAGEPTGFTSFGRTVSVYSNGFEVDSYVPRGKRMKLSGTSMSSPNTANLAAKLLAIDPSLTPVKVIELIEEGADDFGKDGRPMLVINPKRSVEILRERMGKESG